jgi:hypothetical protein
MEKRAWGDSTRNYPDLVLPVTIFLTFGIPWLIIKGAEDRKTMLKHLHLIV